MEMRRSFCGIRAWMLIQPCIWQAEPPAPPAESRRAITAILTMDRTGIALLTKTAA
jgi:hypothetical protein